MPMRKKHVYYCYIFIITAWIFVCLAIQLSLFDVLSFAVIFGPSLTLSPRQLREIMFPINLSFGVVDPMFSLLSPGKNFYHLYHLPKRKWNMQYGEVTSANRDSRFPLGPDFTFHIDYGKRNVTIYEDYGCGCVYRIFLYPPLPTNSEILHRMTSSDLAKMFLLFEVDGVATARFSLKDMMIGKEWPFVSPMSARHPIPASGIAVYMPICYEKSMRIVYLHDNDFPDNLFQLNINCTSNELMCPVHIYSAVSRHKFSVGTRLHSNAGEIRADIDSKSAPIGPVVAKLLESPERRGPSAGVECQLTCIELCNKCQRVLLHKIHTAGVITSLRVRVYESSQGRLSRDWTNVLLSAYFDESSVPQIDHVPIGSLVGATASLNDHRGAAFGKRSMYCDFTDRSHNFDYTEVTGYFYLPMPYWREVLLVIDGTEYIQEPVIFCFQVSEVSNFFVESETGYFHASKTYYGDNVGGWRNVVDVNGGWGQLVGLSMEIDNLRAIRDVSLMYRWAALQADSMIFIDDSQSASVFGTGLEDYFGYAHGFAGAENTTYSFVGVHHAGPQRSEPLTWHCYRQHILDSVTFHNSLRVVMEGTDTRLFMNPVEPLTYNEHKTRLIKQQTSIAHIVLYYFREHSVAAASGRQHCDRIEFGNPQSETSHFLEFLKLASQDVPKVVLIHSRYLGDTARNQTFTFRARSFRRGDVLKFLLHVSNEADVLHRFTLRRTFQWTPRQWNSRCRWSVNGADRGMWLVPMGSLSNEYTLQTDEVMLINGANGGQFEITIEPLSSTWTDVSYELCAVY